MLISSLAVAEPSAPAKAQTPESNVIRSPLAPAPFRDEAEPHLIDSLILKYRPQTQLVLESPPDGEYANDGQPLTPARRLSPVAMQILSRQAGISLTPERAMSGDAFVLALPGPVSFDEAALISKKLMQLSEVEYVVPNGRKRALAAPSDAMYTSQWHYAAPDATTYGVNLPGAWEMITGSTNITIAVIDTGILFAHPDLIGRVAAGYDFVSSGTRADDGDGRDPDPSDPTYSSACPWHGTHVAGTIGAATDNAIGVAGINWISKILPVRVMGQCYGEDADVIDGMRWAAGLPVPNVPINTSPARVLNLSLGGKGSCDSAFQDAIDEITARGAVIVVAAGNNGTASGGGPVDSPANCANVITVAASNRSGNRAWYSSVGPGVEISAPGGECSGPSCGGNGVLSTFAGPTTPATYTYAYEQGTSMAAPHVAGIASLMLSVKPSLTPAWVALLMQNTATKFPATSTCDVSKCGAGIVNAQRAVAAARPVMTITHTYLPLADKHIPNSGGPGGTLVNGNFEQGYAAWITSSVHNDILIYTAAELAVPPHGGNWAARMGGTDRNDEKAVLKQSLVVPLQTPHLSFWHMIASTDLCSDTFDTASVVVNGKSVTKTNLCTDTDTKSNWVQQTVDLSLYAGAFVTLEFVLKADGTIPSTWLLDDIAFQSSP
jgi:serine protease